jgi:ubiquinone/menaquinone biosynthesis C-methylase UbiE
MPDHKIKDITYLSYNNELAVKAYADMAYLFPAEEIIFKKYFNLPGKILDLGCGAGRTSNFLYKLGHDVTAIDYSEEMIRKAKEKNILTSIDFKVMNAKYLLFVDESFDYALFSFNGLDYLYPEADRLKALREIYRVLKPGGIFAFSSHNSLLIPNTVRRMFNFVKSAMAGRILKYRWDFQGFGKLLTYYVSPKKQIKQLAGIGFKNIEIISKYSNDAKKALFKDPYFSYVVKK